MQANSSIQNILQVMSFLKQRFIQGAGGPLTY